MKILKTALFICFPLVFFGQVQEFIYKNYDWKEVPDQYELTEEEKKLDEVILKYKKTIHLLQMGDELREYHLLHKIVKLNNDKAIQSYNKYYVMNGGSLEVKIQKARVINPNGKIINLSQKEIIDSKDENGEINYQYFAFEGVEVGSIIEYLDLVVYPPNLTGSVINVQGNSLKKNVEIDIVTPEHIEYLTFPVNGLENFKKDSLTFFNRRIYLNLSNVPALEEEPWSSWDANIQKVYYKFNKNTATKKSNFYTYSVVSKDLHERYFAQLTKKEKSDVVKLIEKSGAGLQKTTEEKVRVLESYLKKEIVVLDGYFENSEDVSYILSKKVTTDNGFCKLALNCLREMNIDFELVLTSDRYVDKFISGYEAYNFLKELLIYVKECDKYLSHDLLHRFGFPPDNYLNNNGLFMSEVRIGDLYTGVGKVKFLNGTKSEQSVDVINTKSTFEPDFSSTRVRLERSTSGYKAQPYQSVIDLLDEERRQELKEDYLSYIDKDTKVEDASFENDKSDDFGVKPFIGRGILNSVNFIEKGGANYLFKIGMLIGPQSDLYNQKDRKSAVETGSPRCYLRRIEVEIPEGYIIKNLDALQVDNQPDKKENSLGFTSRYTLNGNILVVEINEWYNKYIYPVEDYPMYESVMNEAADFNKIVIAFQKKE